MGQEKSQLLEAPIKLHTEGWGFQLFAVAGAATLATPLSAMSAAAMATARVVKTPAMVPSANVIPHFPPLGSAGPHW